MTSPLLRKPRLHLIQTVDMPTEDKPFVECPNCKSLIANDKPALYGKRVGCPKCNSDVRLPKIGSPAKATSDGLTERQLLNEIRSELVAVNKVLSFFYILAIINLVCFGIYIVLAILSMSN